MPTYKVCTRCKQNQPTTEYNKNVRLKSGLTSHCKTCAREENQRQRLRRGTEYERKWNSQNKERRAEYSKKYNTANPHVMQAIVAKRKAAKLQATPDWLTEEQLSQIKALYAKSASMSTPHHVDHIVPLQGENVCGLHVPWNLRVIPADENIRKSNKF